jgi:hypothetical protein
LGRLRHAVAEVSTIFAGSIVPVLLSGAKFVLTRYSMGRYCGSRTAHQKCGARGEEEYAFGIVAHRTEKPFAHSHIFSV